MKPTIGRIVHYRSYGTPGGEYDSECRAALVTEVSQRVQNMVGLAVMNPTGMFFNREIEHDEDRRHGGTWHWPCVRAEEERA